MVVCSIMEATTHPGAQTERRGDAGPVRGLLGGKDRTGRLFLFLQDGFANRPANQDGLQNRPIFSFRQKSFPETTSPRHRVLRAWSEGSATLSLTNRTPPSAKAKLAPCMWPLPKAHCRSNSAEESPSGGIR